MEEEVGRSRRKEALETRTRGLNENRLEFRH